jgi:hypothetical protein
MSPAAVREPVDLYGGEERGLIGLYRNDGSVWCDRLLVCERDILFTMVEEGGNRAVEHVIPFDELDLQRTIDVNTRRGFRMVLRDEPWQQYLKDHPDLTPPRSASSTKEPAASGEGLTDIHLAYAAANRKNS